MGMFSDGDDAPRPPSLAKAPPPQDFPDVIDELTRVESITVNENGKKKRIIRSLPQTAEEAQNNQYYADILKNSMNAILNLYQYDPSKVTSYLPLINSFANLDNRRQQELGQITNLGNIAAEVQSFKDMNTDVTNRFYEAESRKLEENFAHAGQSDSTSARRARRQLAEAKERALRYGQVESVKYGEDLKKSRLDHNSSLFALNEMGRKGEGNTAMMEYSLERQKMDDYEKMRQQAMREKMTQFGIAQGIQEGNLNRKMGSQAPGLSNQIFQLQAADDINRTNLENTRRMGEYNMAIQHYNSQGPSLGDSLLNMAGTGIGAMFNSPQGSIANKFGSKLFGI